MLLELQKMIKHILGNSVCFHWNIYVCLKIKQNRIIKERESLTRALTWLAQWTAQPTGRVPVVLYLCQ